MMNHLEDIFTEYNRMRDNGLDAKSALNTLRAHIETLSRAEREELAARLRQRETTAPASPPPAPPVVEKGKSKASSIRPIAPPVAPPPAASAPNVPIPDEVFPAPVTVSQTPVVPLKQTDEIVWVACPNCGKANQRHEVFCYSCGQLLEQVKGASETRQFGDVSGTRLDSEFFSPESVMVLRVRGSTDTYETRPQNADHELIVGRSTFGSAMAPDIDLRDRQAEDLGVSRLHLSLNFNREANNVLVSDLGSANGTFINGQRLMPKEVRVLRHGDELRLGKLVLMVSFRHPPVD